MPTQTFFNLPKTKRQRLITAGITVFSHASLDQAAVSDIVRLAEISRGSFYQYFSDKTDLYFYLLSQMREEWVAHTEGTLRRHQGDLFAAARELSAAGFKEVTAGPHKDFFQTLFTGFNYRGTAKMDEDWTRRYRAEHRPSTNWSGMVDASRLNVANEAQLLTLVHMLFGIFAQNVARYFTHAATTPRRTADQYMANMLLMIDWLQYGVEKQNAQEES